jgi:hypothetical protein
MSYYKLPKKRYILKQPPISSGNDVVIASGMMVLQGNWEGSTNVVPTLGKLSDAIKSGYIWNVNSSTTSLLGPDDGIIPEGTMLLALIDNPGADPADKTKWKILYGAA